jgi:hypothetical protein
MHTRSDLRASWAHTCPVPATLKYFGMGIRGTYPATPDFLTGGAAEQKSEQLKHRFSRYFRWGMLHSDQVYDS